MATLLTVCAMAAALVARETAPGAEAFDADAYALAWDAAVPTEMGTLDLKSDPSGAEVVIDGQKTGVRTPGTVTLSAGQHQLTLSSPKPKEFKDRSLTITIVAGKPTRLTLELARVPH